MVYSVALRNDMILPGKVYGVAWRDDMVCGNAYDNFMFYGTALGYGLVHMWRSLCQLEVLFTRTGSIHKSRYSYMHVQFTCTAPVHSGQ